MSTYLVVERPERLEAPGAEYEILHGAVMTAKGLDAWAPRHLETAPGTPFLALADTAKAKGYALFALPTKGEPGADAGGTVTEELTLPGSRTVLVRHAPDWQGSARVRWQGADGGVIELEAPGWLAEELTTARREIDKLRGEAVTLAAQLADAVKSLEGERAENARLKAGMAIPASATRGKRGKAPASPAIAPVTADTADGSKTVAEVKAELAATLEKEASANPPQKRKYRGSAGDD